MASSSDLLGLSGAAGACAPQWLAALTEEAGFQEGLPFRPEELSQPSGETERTGGERDAIKTAYSEGEAAGRAAAQLEASSRIEALKTLRATFRTLDQSAMDCLAEELAATVTVLCEKMFENAALDLDALMIRTRKAAERIGGAGARITIHMNPEDHAALAESLAEQWNVVADPKIARGGLIAEGPDGALHDGPAEWRRAIREALAT